LCNLLIPVNVPRQGRTKEPYVRNQKAEKVRGKDVKKVSINELAKILMDDVDVSISESASAADALCDIDAASDERMSSIEDAICDLDKIINGGETA
jgi:hypothetical protein